MIHHAGVDVGELARSGRFYDAVLGPLGWRRLVDDDGRIGWGIVRPVFFAASNHPPVSGGSHVCFAAGSIPALPFNLPLLKGGVLTGVDVAQIARREPEAERRVTAQLFTWLSEKKLVPVVGQVFSFADFRDAFRAMQSRSALGKMVVRIG